jgi:mRNA interferase RelE/StbE
MPARTIKIPTGIRDLVRRLHPVLKRKIRSALADIITDPACGKPLERELNGYWSLGVGRHRIIYRPIEGGVEIVAIGPRRMIYEEAVRQILRSRRRS